MKFRILNLGYVSCPKYPYNFRIEITECSLDEIVQLDQWLDEHEIPHTRAGFNYGVFYLKDTDADMFVLKWS